MKTIGCPLWACSKQWWWLRGYIVALFHSIISVLCYVPAGELVQNLYLECIKAVIVSVAFTGWWLFVWDMATIVHRVPTDKPRKISMIFHWYFKTKIPNFHDNFKRYKMEKRRTTCYAWSPDISYDHYLVFLRKSVKSCYFIWWIIYHQIIYM